MSEDNSDPAFRRTVLTTIAGAGSVGVVGTPALAAADESRSDDEYPMGPVTTSSVEQTENSLTYDELGAVLDGADGGDVALVDGEVRNERIYVGDDRNVSVAEIEDRFSGTDSGVVTPDADSGTWVVDCRTLPVINQNVCTKITFNVYTWGIGVDFIVYGYPLWGGGFSYSNAAVSVKFNVPVLPIKGEATLGVSQIGGCDVSLDAEVEFKVYLWKVGPFSGSKEVEYC